MKDTPEKPKIDDPIAPTDGPAQTPMPPAEAKAAPAGESGAKDVKGPKDLLELQVQGGTSGKKPWIYDIYKYEKSN